MKSSRAMLLAAMLFAVPAIADEIVPQNQVAQAEKAVASKIEDIKEVAPTVIVEAPKTETPSWLAAKVAVLTGLGTTVADYTVAPVANWTTIPALKQLLRISYLNGGKFEKNIPAIGKTMIAIAAAAGAYKLYQAAQDQDDSNDDEEIFGE